jgi:ubiquinone/menaquinone biosynthesis C-methylase UbiE
MHLRKRGDAMGWFRRRRTPTAEEVELWGGEAPYRLIGGRRRKAGVPYMLPFDLEEHNRLDFQHYLLRAALGGNYAAPITSPRDILDVGTGTGRWAIEMAESFPQAKVIGLDVNPPGVDTASRGAQGQPPNYAFVQGNVLERLPFSDASFDFVHMRALVAAIPHDRWPYVISELIRVTRTGGWVESLEATAMEGGTPATDQLMAWLTAALARRGIIFADGGKVGQLLRAAGLAHVKSAQVNIPCGEAGGRVGRMGALDFSSLMQGLGGIIVAQGLTTAEQFERTLTQARLDLSSPTVRGFIPDHIAYGQRAR